MHILWCYDLIKVWLTSLYLAVLHCTQSLRRTTGSTSYCSASKPYPSACLLPALSVACYVLYAVPETHQHMPCRTCYNTASLKYMYVCCLPRLLSTVPETHQYIVLQRLKSSNALAAAEIEEAEDIERHPPRFQASAAASLLWASRAVITSYIRCLGSGSAAFI
jgi:hypothetical protein